MWVGAQVARFCRARSVTFIMRPSVRRIERMKHLFNERRLSRWLHFGQGAPAARHRFTFAANSSCGMGTGVLPSPGFHPHINN